MFTQETIHSMDRLKDYTNPCGDWVIHNSSLREVITHSFVMSGMSLLGVNGGFITDVEYVDEHTISFKAVLTRSNEEVKIKGIAHAYMSITFPDGDDDPDATSYLSIYWDMDS